MTRMTAVLMTTPTRAWARAGLPDGALVTNVTITVSWGAGSWHSLTGAALESKAVQSSSETRVQRAERWVKWRAWEGCGR